MKVKQLVLAMGLGLGLVLNGCNLSQQEETTALSSEQTQPQQLADVNIGVVFPQNDAQAEAAFIHPDVAQYDISLARVDTATLLQQDGIDVAPFLNKSTITPGEALQQWLSDGLIYYLNSSPGLWEPSPVSQTLTAADTDGSQANATFENIEPGLYVVSVSQKDAQGTVLSQQSLLANIGTGLNNISLSMLQARWEVVDPIQLQPQAFSLSLLADPAYDLDLNTADTQTFVSELGFSGTPALSAIDYYGTAAAGELLLSFADNTQEIIHTAQPPATKILNDRELVQEASVTNGIALQYYDYRLGTTLRLPEGFFWNLKQYSPDLGENIEVDISTDGGITAALLLNGQRDANGQWVVSFSPLDGEVESESLTVSDAGNVSLMRYEIILDTQISVDLPADADLANYFVPLQVVDGSTLKGNLLQTLSKVVDRTEADKANGATEFVQAWEQKTFSGIFTQEMLDRVFNRTTPPDAQSGCFNYTKTDRKLIAYGYYAQTGEQVLGYPLQPLPESGSINSSDLQLDAYKEITITREGKLCTDPIALKATAIPPDAVHVDYQDAGEVTSSDSPPVITQFEVSGFPLGWGTLVFDITFPVSVYYAITDELPDQAVIQWRLLDFLGGELVPPTTLGASQGSFEIPFDITSLGGTFVVELKVTDVSGQTTVAQIEFSTEPGADPFLF